MKRKYVMLLTLLLSVAMFTSCGEKDIKEAKEYEKINCEDVWEEELEKDVEFSGLVYSNGLLEYDDDNYLIIFSDDGKAVYTVVSKDLIDKDDIKKDDVVYIKGTTETIKECTGVRADKITIVE